MTEPLINVADITVQYSNGAIGVTGLSLELHKGQTVALLGPNGAGKSTTLRAISGFLRSEGARVIRGTISFQGSDITNFEPHQVAWHRLICIPERRKVFPNLSVTDNLLAMGRRPRGQERARRLARVFELFPQLASRGREYAGRLSGGQQQMLAIGRGLMAEPEALLLDEMTLGLHSSVKPVLADAVREINKSGTSIILSDEAADFAVSLSSYVYLIRDGRLAGSGQPDQIPNALSLLGPQDDR